MLHNLSLLIWLLCLSSAYNISDDPVYISDDLIIYEHSKHVYQHISYLRWEGMKPIACNGMIVTDNNEAIVFDTPADEKSSIELIEWVEKNLNAKITAVVPTHFHHDCLAGLDVFHQKNIPSFAHNLTIDLAQKNNMPLPKQGFEDKLAFKVGKKIVYAEYFGAGHTLDNIIGYFPDEQTIFGGCLVKSLKSGKGNLANADTLTWPLTMDKIKTRHPDLILVIPGHGKAGDVELLDYTIKMFLH